MVFSGPVTAPFLVGLFWSVVPWGPLLRQSDYQRSREVDYEKTVADLEGAARRLVRWCGLEWEPACLEFHRATRVVRTASAVQVRQPVFRTSVGRWKHYEQALGPLFARLESVVARNGANR
jgi:hypothetical protein